MNIQPVELIGKQVKLVPLEENHLHDLYEAGASSEIWTYMPIQVQSIEDMRRLVQGALDAKNMGTEFPFVVVDRESNRVLGSTRFLNISEPNRHVEIGWTWYTRDVWRTRVNTECKYLLLRHCFETLNTVRVQLKADNRNERSKKAIERIGAKKEGVLRCDRILSDGFIRDSAYFSIIAKEWEEVRAMLELYLGDFQYEEKVLSKNPVR